MKVVQGSSVTTGVKASELRLGDVIKPECWAEEGYETGTVVEETDEVLVVFRPYIHLNNFSYGGKVIHYIGYEKYSILKYSTATTYTVFSRKELK